jgi:hypothetical protein
MIAPSGRELYHFQLSLQAAGPETFGYTIVFLKDRNIYFKQCSLTYALVVELFSTVILYITREESDSVTHVAFVSSFYT